MPVLHLEWKSEVLRKDTRSIVFLPKSGEPPFPTLYLLHGMGDDQSAWLRRTRLEVYLEALPLVVVLPDGYQSMYTDHEDGPPYGIHLAEEIPAVMERWLPLHRERSGRAVGGLSMGGYGALRAALAYPDRYVSAHSHSGALRHGGRRIEEWERTEWKNRPSPARERGFLLRVFGENPIGSRHDLEALAKAAHADGKLPALHLDCGREDFLLEDNREFHRRLEAAGIPHTYIEHDGAHNWDYWDLHIREALAFHARHLGMDGALSAD
ncbi:MAG: esterase family protein [Puniceicoccaceae bacterium]|nr:MAG: esterase family protein [Puniceicoccaceae bacterium]